MGELLTAEEACEQLIRHASHQLAAGLIGIWPSVRTEDRAYLLAASWPRCDSTWRLRTGLRQLFLDCGFVGDGPAPTEAVRLFRGVADPSHARGLAWTTSYDIAVKFSCHLRQARWSDTGYVYTVEARPSEIFGRFADQNEDEYVVDFVTIPRVKRIGTIWGAEGSGMGSRPALS